MKDTNSLTAACISYQLVHWDFLPVVWVFHHGFLPQVESHTNMVTQFSNDGEPVHGHVGTQAERACIYPQLAETASLHPKEAPRQTQLWFQLGLLGLLIGQIFLHVRSAGTTDEGALAVLDICFPLQSSCFEITCLYCWSISVSPSASMGIVMPEKQMRQSTTLPSFFFFFLILQYTQILTYHPDKALFTGVVPTPLQCLLLGSLISWSLRDAVQIS